MISIQVQENENRKSGNKVEANGEENIGGDESTLNINVLSRREKTRGITIGDNYSEDGSSESS